MLNGVWLEVEPSVEIESADDLNRFIDHVEAVCQYPTAISVEAHGYRADLLVGYDQSFVHLLPEEPDLHPYHVTVGGTGEGDLDYWLHSWHHSGIEARHLIPKQLAREAFCEFVQSGKLSAAVQWEQYSA